MHGHDRKPYDPEWTWREWLLVPVWVAGMVGLIALLWLFLDTVLTIAVNL